jgi:hypothetical protein
MRATARANAENNLQLDLFGLTAPRITIYESTDAIRNHGREALEKVPAPQIFAERSSRVLAAASKVTRAIQKTSSSVGKFLDQMKRSSTEKAALANREKLRGTKQASKTAAKKDKHNDNFHSH